MPWKGHWLENQNPGPRASSAFGSSLSPGRLPPTCLPYGHEGPGDLQGPCTAITVYGSGETWRGRLDKTKSIGTENHLWKYQGFPMIMNTIGLVLFAKSQPCEIKSNKRTHLGSLKTTVASYWKLQLVLLPPNMSSLSCFWQEDKTAEK